jgi:hypothetical protein
MKKQIFILIVALMASVTMLWGQTTPTPSTALALTGAVTCPVPRAITGLIGNDALHPVPGAPYTYQVNVPNPAGTKSYYWQVTQNQTFLTAGILNTTGAEVVNGLHLAAAGAELNNETATGTGEDIIITWKSFTHDPTAPVFVVIYVVNDDGSCSTQNVKVWMIEPISAFSLDIANVEQNGTVDAYGTDYSTCVSNIASAVYDIATGGGVIYDFGTDYLFFTVTAANFTTSWNMTLNMVNDVVGTQVITATEWAYSNAPTVWAPYVAGGPILAQDPTGTVGAAGECIIIRLTVAHNKEEILAPQTITLAVDGTSGAAGIYPDLHHVDGLADGFTNDFANHILKPRPTILEVNPAAPSFLPIR